jgi:hypothetical protein
VGNSNVKRGAMVALAALGILVGGLATCPPAASAGQDGPRPEPTKTCFPRPDGSYFCK